MSEVPQYVLFEHAVGYVLFKVKEFEDIGTILPEVRDAVNDIQRFNSIVKLFAIEPFQNTEAALLNCKDVSEGVANDDLINFLEEHLPKKKKKFLLGVGHEKLAISINERTGTRCTFTGVVLEILRGIRTHFNHLVKGLTNVDLEKSQLALGHSFSRFKVKFDVHRVDNMIINSISLLDQFDKDINLFGMRIREWYAYHFPELALLVPDLYNYSRCALSIIDRANINTEEVIVKLKEIFPEDEEKVEAIVEAARTSMGMEITDLDLSNIEHFANEIARMTERRQKLHDYLKARMETCAPSLNALIGEQVGARLISRAGSLTNLAKNPASTVQILGAEKSLFRAIKSRTNTPKFGLIYHSSFIGRASGKNKGRISRYLANKCSIASRIDCFSEIPVSTFGEYLRNQVEARLEYFHSGKRQRKNKEIMNEAIEQAKEDQKKALKRKRKAEKKAAKKAKLLLDEEVMDVSQEVN